MKFSPVDKALVMTLSIWWENNQPYYPWRKITDEYSVIVTELLLQHTDAKRVASLFGVFMNRFPDWMSLMFADLNDIQSTIQPLGLAVQKSKRLQELSAAIHKLGGKLPESRDSMERLPGIGSLHYKCCFEHK